MKPINRRLVYLSMVFVSGLISVYDNVLNYLTMSVLESTEQNPVALWIIQQSGVDGLVCIKASGTVAACTIMALLVYFKWRIAIIPVFASQIGLFCYLSFWTTDGSKNQDDSLTTVNMAVQFYIERI